MPNVYDDETKAKIDTLDELAAKSCEQVIASWENVADANAPTLVGVCLVFGAHTETVENGELSHYHITGSATRTREDWNELTGLAFLSAARGSMEAAAERIGFVVSRPS